MTPRHAFVRLLRAASLVSGACLVALAARSHDARAAWPPAPGADMTDKANWPNDPDYPSRWNYFSWLPVQQPNTPAYVGADVKLGASGMSVDKGWTYSIGRSDVKIAILDSGIEWDRDDLVNKAFLNTGELQGAHKPQTALGQACGGAGALAGYDCNGDGVFSVADYRDDKRIAPPVPGDKCFVDPNGTKGPDRILGDLNHNCILDAGDIIELFSDGQDDDANGYTDDISGWDFYKNDNDPYDDTRYGHGSGEARDSNAEGNNGIDTVGVCPLCRFMMLRAGDSFIADANDFAKGVVYAADNGAKVVQEALGTVDRTAFSDAAIDYAYGKGVIVVASMADENSRHHNMPGTTNHTFAVHAITHDGPDWTAATTFIAFNTCTNYGGQMAVSVSGGACSSEATGRASGIAGLIFSYASSLTPALSLSAEEVMQLGKMTADDIDVPESRNPDPNVSGKFYESKPGWDQRFGYGRMNVARAMQAVKDGVIPPEVDIVSPGWFEPLYADHVTGPVPIVGRVAASRATAYDVAVAWAPGVEPDEKDFVALGAPLLNVPGGTVTGGPGAPLGMIDPRDVDTSHVADPDSPHNENARTVTLRVTATAHYPNGKDIKGEARRTISITNQKNGLDQDLLPGFPIKLGSSAEAGLKLADIDGDQVRDIVMASTDGNVHVYTLRSGLPVEAPGFPFHTLPIDGLNATSPEPSVPSYLAAPAYAKGKSGGIDPAVTYESIVGSPAVADVNGDGLNEIAFTTWSGTIYIVDSKGQNVAGWPKRLPLVPSCSLDPAKPKPPGACMDILHGFARGGFASPVLIDMDKDGKLELIQAAFDGNIYIFHQDGTPLDGWPVAVHSPRTKKFNRIMSTPAVSDFNGDGIPDLVTGSNEEIGGGGGAGPVFMIDGRGMKAPGGPYLPNWPITMVSLHLFPVVAEGIDSSPAAFDIDGDGKPETLLQGNGAPPFVLPTDPGAQPANNDPPNLLPVRSGDTATPRGFDPSSIFGEMSTANRPDTMLPLFSQPSVGDLDQDGTPDIVLAGGSLSLAGNLAGGSSAKPFQHLLAMWSGKTGHMMPGAPVVLEDYTFLTNETIADITGDSYPEVMVGTGGYFVHAVDACGHEAEGWPKFTNGWIISAPAVGDVDGDSGHTLEVVDATRDGYLFAWHTKGREDGVIQWESFHHDNANTGDYGHKLDQGVTNRAAKPIDCSVPAPPPASSYEAGGCSVGGAGDFGTWLTGLGGLALVGVRLRRRRR